MQSPEGWLETFLAYQIHEKNFSSHTVKGYAGDIRSFLDFMAEKGWILTEIRSRHIRSFLMSLQKNPLSTATVSRKMSSLRSFFRFLLRRNALTSNPLANMKTPKSKRRLPDFLQAEEITQLLAAPPTETLTGKRDRAILEVLYGSGIRAGELASLDKNNVDLTRNLLKVYGKGKRERIVPLSQPAAIAIKDYLKARPRTKSAALFLNKDAGRLTCRSIGRILDKYCRQVGLPASVTPHTLRHTFATHLLQSGANLRAVQELLGHKSLSATQIYTHISPGHLQKTYQKTHPRA